MARYLLLAFSGATEGPGNEEALEEWYKNVHIPELLADEEMISAQRYKVVQGAPDGIECPYVTVYEMETEDMDALNQRQMKSISPLHPALDRSRTVNILVEKVPGDAA